MSVGLRRIAVLACVHMLLIAPGASRAQERFERGGTIGDLLIRNGIEVSDGLAPEVRDLSMRAVLTNSGSDTNEFVFVGYAESSVEDNILVDPRVQVVLADRQSGVIRHSAVVYDEVPGIGSMQRLLRTSNHIYVGTHLNPSAGTTLVLDNELNLIDSFYGWHLAELPNEAVIFHNSMIHFMSTHPARVSVYDPARREEREIYPPEPIDPVRQDFIERVRAAYELRGRDWFRNSNHHMDPASFDTAIMNVVTDDNTATVAFHAKYFNPINDAEDPLTSEGDVVVTCVSVDRIDQIQCRERSLDEWATVLNIESAATEDLLRAAAANPGLVQ